jgi:hypothetical protein
MLLVDVCNSRKLIFSKNQENCGGVDSGNDGNGEGFGGHGGGSGYGSDDGDMFLVVVLVLSFLGDFDGRK